MKEPGKVNIHPVKYKLNGLDIVANVHTPADYDPKKKYAAVAVARANGGVKKTDRGPAEGRNVRFLDGPKLERMLKQARRVVGALRTVAAPVAQTTGDVRENSGPLNPTCPKCLQQMKCRKATKGARAGQDFWGCVTYSQCRGTRATEANA